MKKYKKYLFGFLTIAAIALSGANSATGSIENEVKYLPVKQNVNLDDYYSTATGTGDELLNNLRSIISGHFDIGYKHLTTIYADSDVDENGIIYDIYSNITHYTINDFGGNYDNEGDICNKEHTIPQSWFGKKAPMVSDAHMVYPSDGKINNMRSSYLFGEVSSVSKESANGYSKLGSSKYKDYSGTVFEPNDEWKGDMARAHFYAITRYSDAKNWGHEAFSPSNTYFYLTKYYKNLFVKWHNQDPVSQREIDRNNGIYKHQKNRNPFVDHPEYVDKIWGSTSDYGDTAKPETLTITPSVANLTFGQTYKFGVNVTPSNGDRKVIWSSDNTNVVKVDEEGTFTANGVGSTTISATSVKNPSLVAKATVNVKDVKEIKLTGTPSKTTYVAGEKFDPSGLAVNITYTDESTGNVDVNSCKWVDGTTGLEKLSEGTTSVKCICGSKSAMYSPIVVEAAPVLDNIELGFKATHDGGGVVTGQDAKESLTSGYDEVESITDIAKVYPGAKGLKFGSSSGSGSLTINLKTPRALSAIEVKVAQFKSESPAVQVNNINAGNVNGDGQILKINLGSAANLNANYANQDVSSITIKGLGGRFYLQGLNLILKQESVTPPTPVVVPVTGLELTCASEITLDVNETAQITYNVLPADATNKKVNYSTTDEANIQISDTGLITALNETECEVYVSTEDGNFTKMLVVIVKEGATTPDITEPNITEPDVTNPDISEPDVTNPDVTNPDVTEPDISNPDISLPDSPDNPIFPNDQSQTWVIVGSVVGALAVLTIAGVLVKIFVIDKKKNK